MIELEQMSGSKIRSTFGENNSCKKSTRCHKLSQPARTTQSCLGGKEGKDWAVESDGQLYIATSVLTLLTLAHVGPNEGVIMTTAER